MSAVLHGVPSGDVTKFWPIVEHWIDERCSRLPESHDCSALFLDCVSAKKQFWLAVDGTKPLACMITGIKDNGEVHIYLATGEQLTDWAHLFHEFKALSKSAGFRTITSWSRKGWLKALQTTQAKVRRVEMVWTL